MTITVEQPDIDVAVREWAYGRKPQTPLHVAATRLGIVDLALMGFIAGGTMGPPDWWVGSTKATVRFLASQRRGWSVGRRMIQRLTTGCQPTRRNGWNAGSIIRMSGPSKSSWQPRYPNRDRPSRRRNQLARWHCSTWGKMRSISSAVALAGRLRRLDTESLANLDHDAGYDAVMAAGAHQVNLVRRRVARGYGTPAVPADEHRSLASGVHTLVIAGRSGNRKSGCKKTLCDRIVIHPQLLGTWLGLDLTLGRMVDAHVCRIGFAPPS